MIGTALELLLSFALTYFVHSTLLIGAVALALRAFRPRSNPLRETLWTAALFGGFFTAALQTAGLAPGVPTLRWQTASPVVERASANDLVTPMSIGKASKAKSDANPSRIEPSAVTEFPQRRDRASESPRREWKSGVFAGGSALPRSSPADPADRAEPPPAVRGGAWSMPRSRDVVGIVLAMGSALGLAWLGLLFVRSRRALVDRAEIRDGALFDRLGDLRRRFSIGQPIRLSVSRSIATPVAFGVRRLEICVPERAAVELDAQQQEAMLAHEIAHLLRRDPIRLLLARGVECVAFFQPLNRLARRELFEVIEQRCDAFAVERLGSGLALAGCLAEVASWLHDRPSRALVPAMAVSSSALGRRIEGLLDEDATLARERRQRRLAPFAFVLLPLAAMLAPQIAVGAAKSLDVRGDEAPLERVGSRAKTRGSDGSNGSGSGSTTPAPPPADENGATGDATLDEAITLLDTEIGSLSREIANLRVVLEERGVTTFDASLDNLESRLDQLNELRRTVLAAWRRTQSSRDEGFETPLAPTIDGPETSGN